MSIHVGKKNLINKLSVGGKSLTHASVGPVLVYGKEPEQSVQFTVNLTSDLLSVDLTGFITAGTHQIDWGDGNALENDTRTHTYASANTYVISVSSDTGITIVEWPYALRKALTKIEIPYKSPITSIHASERQLGFHDCPNLTTIPSKIFSALTDNSISVVSFFENCTSITSIPNGLLDNLPSSTTYLELLNLFTGCTSITSIPSGLLDNLPSLITDLILTDMFQNCTGIKAIPIGLLDNLPTSINNLSLGWMFENCTGITSAVPKWWNVEKFQAASHTYCFKGCTNAYNYSSIPTDWK